MNRADRERVRVLVQAYRVQQVHLWRARAGGRPELVRVYEVTCDALLSELRAARRLEQMPQAQPEQFAPTEVLVQPTRHDGGFDPTAQVTFWMGGAR